MVKLLIAASIALVSIGCASKGFNRGALKDQLGVKAPVVNDAEIAKTLDLKPNLPKPFKLGVYFQPMGDRSYYNQTTWRWEDSDKDAFLKLSQELKSSGLVTEVFQISNSTVTGKDIKSIRLAAARHNADAVMVISGTGDVDKYTNNLGWTYFLLVTGLFVPGNEADALFMTSATLWDVRNEYLYLTAEAEAKTNESYIPAFGKQNKEYLSGAKSKAMTKLRAEVKSMIEGIKR